ncbi:MAG: 30S ribosomal protein S13 [Candidatus Micrarchaeota archaeon]|nr:MAG: 30S ribosomal protein S13 [Candidatus Micrarchaeota archaeon]
MASKPDKDKQQRKAKEQEGSKTTSIVRLGDMDINGELSVLNGIRKIKGIGWNLAVVLSRVLKERFNIDYNRRLDSLNEDELNRLISVINTPQDYGIPAYMLNRRKDNETGADINKIGNELVYTVKMDIKREIDMHSWKGYRHQYGQKVRGQRTRSTGRTGATVGVLKGAAKAQQAQAQTKQGEQKSSAK